MLLPSALQIVKKHLGKYFFLIRKLGKIATKSEQRFCVEAEV
jgi:hypothetical protein